MSLILYLSAAFNNRDGLDSTGLSKWYQCLSMANPTFHSAPNHEVTLAVDVCVDVCVCVDGCVWMVWMGVCGCVCVDVCGCMCVCVHVCMCV